MKILNMEHLNTGEIIIIIKHTKKIIVSIQNTIIDKEETEMYKFMSARTGEVVKNWKEILHVMWYDLKAYHILNLVWKYNKEGW